MAAETTSISVLDNAIELSSFPASHKRTHQTEESSSGVPKGGEESTVAAASITPSLTAPAQDTPVTKTRKELLQGRLYLAALFWTLFLEGWNDGSAGPLIPVMQRDYRVGFAVVSLIFVVNCIGFVIGALSNVWLFDRIGFGKVMVLGAISQTITYAMQTPAPPFPVFVLSYFFSGFGLSLQNAGANGFVGGLSTSVETKLGFLHAFYGLGAFAAPLVATYFSNTKHWTHHFLTSTAMAVVNVAVLCLIFGFKRQEELYITSGDYQAPSDTTIDSSSKYNQIVRIKAVHLLAAFAFIYIGTEVTLGGWIVTFIIEERQGGKDAGYISSGFFGGLTLGRIALLWLNRKIGEHRVIFIYSILIIALQLTVWLVPSLIQNAIAISLVGVFLGPMFPIIVSQAKALLPGWLLNGCIGWITAIGMAGSAALPFFTGLLAGKFGIRSLQPLVVSMMSVLIGVWVLVPKPRRVD